MIAAIAGVLASTPTGSEPSLPEYLASVYGGLKEAWRAALADEVYSFKLTADNEDLSLTLDDPVDFPTGHPIYVEYRITYDRALNLTMTGTGDIDHTFKFMDDTSVPQYVDLTGMTTYGGELTLLAAPSVTSTASISEMLAHGTGINTTAKLTYFNADGLSFTTIRVNGSTAGEGDNAADGSEDSGAPGINGNDSTGVGIPASSGGTGGNGYIGAAGGYGVDGEDGAGAPAICTLTNCIVQTLYMHGSKGGNGGTGGNGGDARGGNGGKGGDGFFDEMYHSESPGGNGGNGGDGGLAGNGGDGGDGGVAWSGGLTIYGFFHNCIISYLYRKSAGGLGGAAGIGGNKAGGIGGAPGVSYYLSGPDPSPGINGVTGTGGSAGFNGSNGADGVAEIDSTDSTITFQDV